MNLQPVSEPPGFRAICKLCKQLIKRGEKLADLDDEAGTYYHAECMEPRVALENEFDINKHGRISDPGKFEGEPLYVPYFWNIYLSGFADEDDGETLTFKVNAEDHIMFPELGEVERIYLFEDSQGFVNEVDGPADEIEWEGQDE